MNREELMRILPHRDEMLLLDEAVLEGDTARGKYRVTGEEFFLRGHFPARPVVPGVILCEMLAQSCCVLLEDKLGEGCLPMYTGLNNVRFKAPVKPGDTVETACRIVRAKPPFWFAEGSAMVGDSLCVKAEFSFAIVKLEDE